MTGPKRVLQLDEPIETVETPDGRWVARLPVLAIEEFADTHDEAQAAAVRAMLARLGELSHDDARDWIETNSSPASPDDLPACSTNSD